MNGWAAVAERQYGAVSRNQLRRHITDRQIHALVAGGRLERVRPAVFRVVGSYPSARQRAMAAVLWCGDDALLSHATAAEVMRLPLRRQPMIHVSAPPHVRRTSPDIVVHRTERLDRFFVDGLPVTSPARTIIDVAPKLEVRAAILLRNHGVIPDITQHRVGDYRIDFAWVRRMLGVECDGYEWHGNRLAWKRDRRRVAFLEAQGWRLIHLTWDDVTLRPDETIARVREAIRRSPLARDPG